MTAKYKVDFDNDMPMWNFFRDNGIKEAFPKINIIMRIYEEDTIIYSIQLNIKGKYYCCGSENFDIHDIKFDIIKDCDKQTKLLIINEIEGKCYDIVNMLNDTILKTRKKEMVQHIYEYVINAYNES
jgi:hypothetical protein